VPWKSILYRLKKMADAADMYSDGEVGHMKIYDHSLTGTAASDVSRSQETHKTEGAREPGSSAPATGDRVEFSGSLGALSRAVSADQSARASRIQALTSQVQQGTYQPDSRAISRGMVADALAGR